MQLDRTQIVIRERGLGEILDLALRAIAGDARRLGLMWLAGAVPFAVWNGLALWPTIAQPATGSQAATCVLLSVLLVFTEMPWALLGVTAYVGQSMFEVEPRLSRVVTPLRQTFFPAAWWLGVIRGPVPVWILVALSVRPGRWHAPAAVLLWLLVLSQVWNRVRRPFLPEIIVLEQPPRTARCPAEMTLTRRTQSLHAGYAGDGFARSLALAGLSVLIVSCVYCTLCFLWETVVSDVQPSWQLALVLPISLWLAAGYFAVVRFLSYIDLRVRREGWEVELLLRAAKADVPDRASHGPRISAER